MGLSSFLFLNWGASAPAVFVNDTNTHMRS